MGMVVVVLVELVVVLVELLVVGLLLALVLSEQVVVVLVFGADGTRDGLVGGCSVAAAVVVDKI